MILQPERQQSIQHRAISGPRIDPCQYMLRHEPDKLSYTQYLPADVSPADVASDEHGLTL